jgi:hypothetical protein
MLRWMLCKISFEGEDMIEFCILSCTTMKLDNSPFTRTPRSSIDCEKLMVTSKECAKVVCVQGRVLYV